MPIQTAIDSISNNQGSPFGFKNRIINGAMVIDQRNAGASVTNVSGQVYTLDRWVASGSQASKFTIQQNAASVTPPTGFRNYLGVTSSSAYTVGVGEAFDIRQIIEGYNAADLSWGTASAATVTLSFWVRSSLTGTFGGALGNSGLGRSYPFSYTISVANTWEQKSITIAGDTSGTWLTTNGIGIYLFFGLGVGTTLSGTAGAWASAAYVSATGATSVVGTNGATFYITGVQLEKGTQATAFDYRPYGTELALCQRYTWVTNSDSISTGIGDGGTGPWCNVVIPVPMRGSPTLTVTGTLCISDQVATDLFAASPAVTVSNLTSVGGRVKINGWGASTVSYRVYTGTSGGGSGNLIFTAEL